VQQVEAEIVIASGVRTPFGRFGGGLKDHSALDLAELVVAEVVRRAGIAPEHVDGVVLGTVVSDTPQGAYMAKHAGLRAGMSERITGLCVNRLCGSGLQAIISAAHSVAFGDGSLYVAGGTECLSHVPFLVPGARYGLRLGDATLVDPLSGKSAALVDPTSGMVMGSTGDRVAQLHGISREEADAFALRSQERALAANRDGSFARDFVTIPDVIEADEHPRETSLEKLGSLRTIFTEDGICTAGNSSGLNDGAGALLVLSAERARELGVPPRARLVSYAVTGCAPEVMGMGPVSATRTALERAGLDLADLDVIEINEAFAAQVLAVGKGLDWDWDRVNPNGGAVAIGHPLGASGARLMVMLLRELEDGGGRYGLATACIGGGQGIAIVVERLP
jgi:acetyl-CoA C-acetyltransferase